ncbi:MAG TPA: tRNA guanosine(34) transglycosylase Tgt [Anaeromyxobacteraceae bacterium]|nr:tRNA guanosine(34) transglycosylase Tgt [Anaeromyxobacteraceae bacterium]
MPLAFRSGARDGTTAARCGAIDTPHGTVETPAFMPVGTRASVTGLGPADLEALGAGMILANAYHLLLRPGPEALARAGGIHRFMAWKGPVLTDSGGFQIFSLAHDVAVSEDGARFRSYVDARSHLLSPERSIEVQTAIGSDVMMALDVCPPSTADRAVVREAMERTHRWALRSLAARTDPGRALFAIVQGGLDPGLRAESARFLSGLPFDGFAIGGLAVGDTREERGEVVARTADLLPPERPRYLMGVGTPPDLLDGIARGVDLFDCVLPTTLAWQGTAFTSTGRVRLTRGEHRLSDDRLDARCACATCSTHSRGYLHHLVKCREPLGPRLLSLHNLHHYLQLVREARAAIGQGRFAAFARERMAAVDRHEHDPAARPPGRRRSPAAGPSLPPGEPIAVSPDGRHEVVLTRLGAPAVRDRTLGEVMHPIVGPAVESERLYVAQSRLRERLAEGGPPLVLFDVGLGAGANALAAWCASEEAPAGSRRLEIASFERDLAPLSLALSPEASAALGLRGAPAAAARALLSEGRCATARTLWRLVRGEALETLAAETALADVIFWDPFSPRGNPEMWTVAAFAAARTRSASRATLFTYSTATATRSGLLLAGFFVGAGDPSGPKEETTAAAARPDELARPLDGSWLRRLERSGAPFPPDAPPDALDRVRAHPQFR